MPERDNQNYGRYFTLQLPPTRVSHRFLWRQPAQRSSLFLFALSRGPHVFVQYIALNIKFLLTTFKEGVGNTFLRFADTRHFLINTFIIRR